MKKTILMCAILTMGTATATVAAPIDVSDETKRNSVIWGSIATGAVAAGPLGAMVGVIAGSWLGEKVETAGQVAEAEEELVKAKAQVDKLSQKLAAAEITTQSNQQSAYQQPEHQQTALEQLQLELLFKTGASELTLPAQLKMSLLASLLIEQPELLIRLDGHADPRGDVNYNQTLTDKRVQVVRNFLIAKGVAAERFSAHSHGASQSLAAPDDYDSYALERVVKVQLTNQAAQNSYVQTTLP